MTWSPMLRRSPIPLALRGGLEDWEDYRFWADILSALLRIIAWASVAQGGQARFEQYVRDRREFAPNDGRLVEIARACVDAAQQEGRDELGFSSKGLGQLNRLVAWRNRYAGHAPTYRLDPFASRQASSKANDIANRIMDEFKWVWSHDWLFLGEAKGRPGRYVVKATILAGGEPRQEDVTLSDIKHPQSMILLNPERSRYLSLDPLVRYDWCPQCAGKQILLLRSAEIDKRTAEWEDRAHRIPEDGVDILGLDFGWHEIAVSPKWDLLFVCTGATCRSPMAVGIVRDLFGEEGRELSMAACGIDLDPRGVDENAVKAVPSSGDVVRRQADRWTLRSARLVLAMKQRHADVCLDRMGPEANTERVQLMGSFAGKGSAGIRDPIGGDLEEYEKCAEELRVCLKAAWGKIQNRLGASAGP